MVAEQHLQGMNATLSRPRRKGILDDAKQIILHMQGMNATLARPKSKLMGGHKQNHDHSNRKILWHTVSVPDAMSRWR